VDAALGILRAHYAAWVMLLALFSLPSIAFSQYMFDAMRLTGGARLAWRPTLLVLGASVVVNAVAEGVAVTAMAEVYLGRPLDLARAIGRLWSRLFPLLLATVIRWVIMIAGWALLVVPGVFASIRTACLDCSVMLDDASDDGLSAFQRAWNLTADRESHVFLTVLLMFAIYAVGYVVALIAVRLAVAVVPVLHGQRLNSLVQAVLLLFVLPVMPAVRTVLYYDLRVRKEGLDVELLARALDAAPAAPPA
jgi:hypothetical protein